MESLIINDITLRDGEQAPGVNFFPEEKLEIAEQLAKMRIPVIEAGFPVAAESDFRAVKLIASILGVKGGPVICAMARATQKDIDVAAEAVAPAARGRVQVVLATSDIHLQYKLKKSRQEVMDLAYELVRYAKSRIDDVEFAAEDATRSDLSYLVEVFKAVVEAGARTVEIPDTTGYSTPDEYGSIIRTVRNALPTDVVIATHCHNDLGLAAANTLAGITAGARQAELTVNGIGERAGNTSLEEVVMALKTRQSLFNIQVDVDTKQIMAVSRLVERLSGLKVAPNKAIVGRNAFLHQSGIHQHGLIANRNTYQIMDPTEIGLDGFGLVLGKLSGKHALKRKITELGLDLGETVFQQVYEDFKEMASKKKQITEEDILNLVRKRTGCDKDPEPAFRLV